MEDRYALAILLYVSLTSLIFAAMPIGFFTDVDAPSHSLNSSSLTSEADTANFNESSNAGIRLGVKSTWTNFKKVLIGMFGLWSLDGVPFYISIPFTVLNLLLTTIAIIYLSDWVIKAIKALPFT